MQHHPLLVVMSLPMVLAVVLLIAAGAEGLAVVLALVCATIVVGFVVAVLADSPGTRGRRR